MKVSSLKLCALSTELKFAECLYIFVQMCFTKLKNDNGKDNVCTECTNINFVILLFLRVILAVCILNCYFIGQVPKCLVQYECSYYNYLQKNSALNSIF